MDVEMLSPNFKIVDDVIYSADGTVLVALLEDETSFTVPESVTTIGSHAFNNVYNLETVYLHEGIEKVESADEFTGLTTIYIPPKTKEKFIPLVDRYGTYGTKKLLKVKK